MTASTHTRQVHPRQLEARNEINGFLPAQLAGAGWSATVGVRDHLKADEQKIIDGAEYIGIGPGQVLLAWHNFLSPERPN